MLSYPVRLIPEDNGYVMLTFHDVPEAVVVGESEDDAIERALPLLETVLGSYVVEGRSIPSPSDICGAPMITTDRFSVVAAD
ncbi:MAG TPA: type II toxin-antitoxin system HicB family antitoxin [Allosphingosinicella sp.]|jgi:antitoxin HicB|nr:type II toxin-antitoxin system HicB family antitoxin [Allosphingosinicella sp.]